jgi:hypothetical protein
VWAAAAGVAIVGALVAGSGPGAHPPAPAQAAHPEPIAMAVTHASPASTPAPSSSAGASTPLPPVDPGGGLVVRASGSGPLPPAVHADVRPGDLPVDVAISPDGIPSVALAAYRRAANAVDGAEPDCGLAWTLLAGIGRVESDHGRFGGAQLLADGLSTIPVIGPPLDGFGTALILDTDHGRLDGDRTFDRAVGPMQFIPSTWAYWAADGDGDGQANPFDIDDAALAAARYLCAAGGDLSTHAGLVRAVLAYNSSQAYLREVLAYAAYYAGTTPDPLPPPAPQPARSSSAITHTPAPPRATPPSRPSTSPPAAPSSTHPAAAPSTTHGTPTKAPSSTPTRPHPTSVPPTTTGPTHTRSSTPTTSHRPTTSAPPTCPRPTGTRTPSPPGSGSTSGTGSTSSGATTTSAATTASSSAGSSVSGSGSTTGTGRSATTSRSATSPGACGTASGAPSKPATTAAGVTGLAGVTVLGLVILVAVTVARRRRSARQH